MRRSCLLFALTLTCACTSEEPEPPPEERDAGSTIRDAGDGTDRDAGGGSDRDAGNGGGRDGGDVSTDGGRDGGFRDAGFPIVEVTVTPTSAVLVSRDGDQPTQAFVVSTTRADGSTAAVSLPDVRVDPAVLGTISSTTVVFTANGRVGGEGRIVATVDGIEGEAAIRIELEQTILTPGTSTTVPPLFDNQPRVTDPNREALVVYPLDGAVMPQNVSPADIQWERGNANDAFRIVLSKPNVQVLAFYATGSRNWTVDLAAWRRIAQSEPTEWATIVVERYDAATGEIIAGTPIQVRFARAALQGSVYYWDIVRGRIVRINDGTTTRDEFMPSPPLGCVGCHSVSTNGRYMAGRFGGGENVGGVLDLTQNLATNPPPTVFPVTSTTAHWWFSTWDPTDTRMVVSTWEQGGLRALELFDPFTGEFIVPMSGTLPTGPVTHPAWSPDGSMIAYTGNANSWGGANTVSDLFVLPVTGLDSFGPPQLVTTGTVPAGPPAGLAASYPTWSPDSGWLAFAHGNSSRSETGQSALYMVRPNGRDLVRLDNASGGAATNCFQPNFSPFQQDGYYWMTFLSRRDYGNNTAGTRGTGRQQVWVSAINVNATPGQDPSEVPYWLPGQNTGSLNISAYWAPRACRMVDEPCGVDAECCSGDCDRNASGDLVCRMGSGCGELGDPCTENAQCCNMELCIDNTCGGL